MTPSLKPGIYQIKNAATRYYASGKYAGDGKPVATDKTAITVGLLPFHSSRSGVCLMEFKIDVRGN